MISDLSIHIIHYTKLIDRKKFLDLIFLKENLKVNYILDHDREDLNYANSLYNYQKDQDNFLFKIKELWKIDSEEFRILSDGELSCYFKHLEALKKISESENSIGLILEDDVIPQKSIKNNLLKISKRFSNSNWDVLFLGLGSGKKFIKKNSRRDLFNINYLMPQHPASNCAEAYMVKKDAAQILLNELSTFNLSYDWELAYKMYKRNLNVRWLFPPLFRQGSQDSTYRSELR